MKTIEKSKGMATPVIIGVLALVILAGGAAYFKTSNQSESMLAGQKASEDISINGGAVTETGDSAVVSDEVMMKKDAMVDGQMVKYEGKVLAGNSSPLLEFNKADYDTAIKSNKLVVLYFYANWCPTCKVEFPKAEAAFDTLTGEQVVGFRVNYKDNETSSDEVNLAREFGVPYQHTKVFIKGGKQVLKSPESWDTARYISEINKALLN
ncbi:MAG: thioredoxin family protein [bacterium]|nr:thioredoxin family protein [bacterium]